MEVTIVKFLLIVPLCGFSLLALAKGDPAIGKQKAQVCSVCHGINGISNLPDYPNLAGQKALYIEKQLKAFRDGKRKSTLMEPMVKTLSDKDIVNLAAYFSKLKH